MTPFHLRMFVNKKQALLGPYIAIGNFQVLSEKAECVEGAEVYVTIHAWSRATGKVELKQIGAKIILALDNAGLSSADVSINCCELDDVNYLDDPDGLTSHGVFTLSHSHRLRRSCHDAREYT